MAGKIDYSQKISFFLTLGIWIIFFVFSLCFSFQKEAKQEFKTISLKLSSNVSSEKNVAAKTQETETLLESTKPAVPVKQQEKQEVSKALSKSLEKKDVPTKKIQPEVVTKSQPVIREEKLVQSIEDAIKAQQKIQKKEVVWDESLFADSEVIQSTNSSVVAKNTVTMQELQGAAALVSTESAGEISVAGTNKKNISGEQTLSEQDLLSLLQKDDLQGAKVTGENDTQVIATSGATVTMNDGSTRQLIHPKKLEINLSAQAQKLIDSSKEVSIVFSVLDEGTIPLSEIYILPRGTLPLFVESEIKAQIAKWRFESGKGNGQARFTYSITKE